jgi:hypothetical protein
VIEAAGKNAAQGQVQAQENQESHEARKAQESREANQSQGANEVKEAQISLINEIVVTKNVTKYQAAKNSLPNYCFCRLSWRKI